MQVLSRPREGAVPLFTLRMGDHAPSSNANHCARLAGVEDPVLERATAIRAAVLAKRPLAMLPLDASSCAHGTQEKQHALKFFHSVTDWEHATPVQLKHLLHKFRAAEQCYKENQSHVPSQQGEQHTTMSTTAPASRAATTAS